MNSIKLLQLLSPCCNFIGRKEKKVTESPVLRIRGSFVLSQSWARCHGSETPKCRYTGSKGNARAEDKDVEK